MSIPHWSLYKCNFLMYRNSSDQQMCHSIQIYTIIKPYNFSWVRHAPWGVYIHTCIFFIVNAMNFLPSYPYRSQNDAIGAYDAIGSHCTHSFPPLTRRPVLVLLITIMASNDCISIFCHMFLLWGPKTTFRFPAGLAFDICCGFPSGHLHGCRSPTGCIFRDFALEMLHLSRILI